MTLSRRAFVATSLSSLALGARPLAASDERTEILDDEQARAIERLAGAPLETRLITLYTGFRGGEVMGTAMIDLHTVRTLPEAFMIVISPEGKVTSLRILAFYEPEEYKPADRWLEQFDRRGLDRSLRIGGDIHTIAGSTLSSRAVTSGVRRSLALFEVLVRGDRETAGGAAGAPGVSGR